METESNICRSGLLPVTVRFNPLNKVSFDFCNRNCSIDRFYFDCSAASFEASENIIKWAEEKKVRVLSGPWSYWMMNFGYVSWPVCNGGGKLFGYESWVGILPIAHYFIFATPL